VRRERLSAAPGSGSYDGDRIVRDGDGDRIMRDGDDDRIWAAPYRLPPMNVLLVSHAFPPVNVIGALRVGKFAKYLHEAGHTVRVLSATPSDKSLALEIPSENVVYAAEWAMDQIFDGAVRWVRRGVRRGVRRARNGVRPGAAAVQAPAAALPEPQQRARWSAALAPHYYALLRIPDARAGWIAAATAAGYEMVRDWRPDIVVGSAPPPSGLVVAARVARVCGAPWVAELRDLWADNSYYEEPAWRLLVDRFLERRLLRRAAGLVGVTPQWSQTLRRHYRQPVACILNGYVEADFPPYPAGPPGGDVVTILYTGNIYAGYRDPSPLFQAVGLLGAERERVAIRFYGPPPQEVMPLAAAHGVQDRVQVQAPVTYKESLALQTAADVLLLLQWNHERDAGNIPAKFYEYLGARRPILLLGYEAGDLAAMIRERKVGVVVNDPAAIARQLRLWMTQKPAGIPAPAAPARAGMTRDEQYQKYERFLQHLLLAQSAPDATVSAPSAPANSLP
jgi:glycosyltransferase involved in cell wall biosynthesis